MNYELLFSAAGILAMMGWLLLLASPWVPKWSDRIASLFIPCALASGYVAIVYLAPTTSGGFGSFPEVVELFSHPQAVMAGWVHFLAFDLIVGAWICRKARAENIPFWFVIPCLPLTFLFGPAGYLAFAMVRLFRKGLTARQLAHP